MKAGTRLASALHILGASYIVGAINIIVTILNLRAPGMALMKVPMFCWGNLPTSTRW